MSQVDRRVVAVLVLVLLMSLAVAGCGGSKDSTSSKSGLKAVDVNATSRDELKDGGTVRWAVDQFSTQWNLNHLDGPTVATATVISAVMPSLFVADEAANLTPNEDYVTSAELTARSPRQVVTYKINPKARWSDGEPITVKDFVAQWKALRSADAPYLVASSTGYERVSSVEQGADEHEVVVTFAKPFAEWQSLFSPLYPEATNSSPEAFNKGWLNKIPVTAGPFKLERIDKTAETVTIVRDEKWWGEPAKLDAIVTRALDVDAAVNALANGEVDVVDVGPDASAYKRALGVQDGAVREAAGPDFRHFTINGTSDVLGDPQVRRAVAMAIDREAIAKADLTGLNWPARTLGNHFFVNTQAGYEDNSGEVAKFDPEAAKALLDQAGWKASGAVRKKDGKTLRVRFVIPAGTPVSRQEGELTQAMLRDVGVDLDLVTVPGDAFFDEYVIPGNFDITPFSWVGTPFPISSAQSIYVKPVKDKSGELQIQQNFARVGSVEIDELMARAEQTLDVDEARELINQADKLVWDEVHSLTLYQRPQIWGVDAKLGNVGAFGFKSVIYEDIGYVK